MEDKADRVPSATSEVRDKFAVARSSGVPIVERAKSPPHPIDPRSSYKKVMSEAALLQTTRSHLRGVDREGQSLDVAQTVGSLKKYCEDIDGSSASYSLLHAEDTCPVDALSWAAFSPVTDPSVGPFGMGSSLSNETAAAAASSTIKQLVRQATEMNPDFVVEQDLNFSRITLTQTHGEQVSLEHC